MHRAVMAAVLVCGALVVVVVLMLGRRQPAEAPATPEPAARAQAAAAPAVVAEVPAAAEPLPAAEPTPTQEPVADEASPAERPRLRLRVVDGLTGEPVRTFEVRWGHQEDAGWTRLNTTDGRFFVPVDAPEGASVRVRARDYDETEATVDALPKELPPHGLVDLFDVPLHLILTLRGVVVDGATGAPVEGAMVAAIEGAASAELYRMKAPDGVLSDHTDAAGGFTLRAFDTRSVRFVAAWKERYAATIVDVAAVADRRAIAMRLTEGGTVRGRLLSEGAPVEGLIPTARMRLGPDGPTYGAFAYVNGGYFVIPRLTPGDHVLEFFDSVDEAEWGRVAVSVADGENTEYQWDMAEFGGLFVTVSDGAAQGVTVECGPAGAPEQMLYAAAPDAEGKCQFGYVPAGRYEIRVVGKSPGARVRRQTQLVAGGQWRDVVVSAP